MSVRVAATYTRHPPSVKRTRGGDSTRGLTRDSGELARNNPTFTRSASPACPQPPSRLDYLLGLMPAKPRPAVASVNDATCDRRKRAARGTGTPPLVVQAVAAAAWGDWDACLSVAARWYAAAPRRVDHLLQCVLTHPVQLSLAPHGLILLAGTPRIGLADLPPRLAATLEPLICSAFMGEEGEADEKAGEKNGSDPMAEDGGGYGAGAGKEEADDAFTPFPLPASLAPQPISPNGYAVQPPSQEPVWDDVLPDKPMACTVFNLTKCVWNKALTNELPRVHLVRALLWCLGPGAPAFTPTLLRTAVGLTRSRDREQTAQGAQLLQTVAAIMRAPPHSVPQAIASCEVEGGGVGYVSLLGK